MSFVKIALFLVPFGSSVYHSYLSVWSVTFFPSWCGLMKTSEYFLTTFSPEFVTSAMFQIILCFV